jgi:alpha-mannosidase
MYCFFLVDLAVANKVAWQLYYDMQIILGMANELDEGSAREQEALYTCNQVIDHFDRFDIDNAFQKCLAITKAFLSKKGAPEGHKVTAVGHW